MTLVTLKSPLNAQERAERRRLILSDALSLVTLFAITGALAVLTTRFYQSYASHQDALTRRWAMRGELALQQGKPQAAIDALRSALAYAPGQRKIEIELAEALAAAGHTQEATAYFNTLAEAEPGNGMINLQLARLAARQGNVAQALEDYHRAIYGNWEGDGYVRRREVRLELVNFLISHNLYTPAENELLIAAGNAPAGDAAVALEIAGLMEKAHSPGDALRLYKSLLERHPGSLEAMQGAGRTAFELGHYLEAKQYLDRAVNNPGFDRQPSQASQQTRDLLRDSTRLLVLYPSPHLNFHARAERILADRRIARTRFESCASSMAAAQGGGAPATQSGHAVAQRDAHSLQGALKGSFANLASRFGRHAAKAEESGPTPAPQPADALANLASRWTREPQKITLSRLVRDPDLVQSEVQLIYDTERITQGVCGGGAGDDALLLKIAQSPDTVEQQ